MLSLNPGPSPATDTKLIITFMDRDTTGPQIAVLRDRTDAVTVPRLVPKDEITC